jgi:uncharacterized membrane protein
MDAGACSTLDPENPRLLVVGSLPLFAVVLPVLGHATWHFIGGWRSLTRIPHKSSPARR